MLSSADSLVEDHWMGLTAKQREVLDLLIQHKTSKEISRRLGISPYTVDQRIMLARAKLKVATRGEVAHAYRLLLAQKGKFVSGTIYDQFVYETAEVAPDNLCRHDGPRENTAAIPLSLQRPSAPDGRAATAQVAVATHDEAMVQGYHHVLPQAFDGQMGTLLRLGAIGMIAALLTLIILGGLAIYAQLSQIVDG